MMKLIGSGIVAAALMSTALAAQAPVLPQAAGAAVERKLSLTGCVVKGDSGYVLADASEQIPAGQRTAPDPFHSRTLYWLDDDDDLKDHVGQRVTVDGKMKSKLEKGEIKAERKDDGVELEFKADGKNVKVMVPADIAVGTSGAAPNKDNEYNIIVLTVDVKSVKKQSDSCR